MSLPCPFCGGNNLSIQTGTEDREGLPVTIRCNGCGATGPWNYVLPDLLSVLENNIDMIAAVTGWNDR